MTAGHAVPAHTSRGARPRNRRALIVAAATELFYRHGYAHVSMGDIAQAVDIGPSALYRHFTGKQQLLREVIREGFAVLRQNLDRLDLSDRTNDLAACGALALDHRELGVLWQREARHVPEADRSLIRQELRDTGQLFTRRVQERRPDLNSAAADLITWTVFSVLTSTSFHRLSLPRPDYERLLSELTGIVLDAELPAEFGTPPAPARQSTLIPRSRREALLSQAIRMFAEDGYAGVGIEDIGAGLGISGTSIYKHFPNKLDMLITAINRGITWLRTDHSRIITSHTSATGALSELIRSYIDFARAHHHLIGLLITEQQHLPDDERQHCRQAQHEYIDEWVHLLHTVRPQLEPAEARIRVRAVLSVANDIARTPHLRRNPGVPAVLAQVCTRMLELPA